MVSKNNPAFDPLLHKLRSETSRRGVKYQIIAKL